MPFEFLIVLVKQNQILASLIAGFLNEELSLALGVLASQKLIFLWKVILFGIIGSLFSDLVSFYLARTKYFNKLKEHFRNKNYLGSFQTLKKISFKNYFLMLFPSKFIYGTRMLTILYVSSRGMPLRKFIFYDLLALTIWFCTMIPLAWFLGTTIFVLFDIKKDFEKIVFITIGILLAIYLVNRWISSRIKKEIIANS